ncbi:hypothetical protein IAT40_005183 [Kwoniella sp. CBS 6097]
MEDRELAGGEEDDDGGDLGVVPPCPNGIFHLALGSSFVDDPDEEIMELYMNLASTSPENRPRTLGDAATVTDHADGEGGSGGLGFLDSNSSILQLSIDLFPLTPAVIDRKEARVQSEDKRSSGRSKRGIQKADKRAEAKGKGEGAQKQSVGVLIQQDLGALKGRKGDTGSVLWRSSLHLARQLLTQHYYPPRAITCLLDPAHIANAKVLELGSGTGLLAVLLSQICGSYTASDRLENLKLVKRNLEINGIPVGEGGSNIQHSGSQEGTGGGTPSNIISKTTKGVPKGKSIVAKKAVNLEEIDWVAVSQERNRHPCRDQEQERTDPQYDLVLAVDCIYNEHLVQPLVDTLARYCPRGGRSVVWVVVELRSADVLTLFLEKWMNDSSGPWTIVRLSAEAMGGWQGSRARWVSWVGWR